MRQLVAECINEQEFDRKCRYILRATQAQQIKLQYLSLLIPDTRPASMLCLVDCTIANRLSKESNSS